MLNNYDKGSIMKKIFVSILLVIISCSNDHETYSIEDFMDVISFGGSSFSYDESSILIRSNESGIFNAYEVDLKTNQIVQLTFSDTNSIFPIGYLPNDKRFLFRGDQGGNEIWHVYLHELDGSIRDLTPGENVRSLFLDWADDQRSFFFTSNSRDQRFMDLYEMDIESLTSNLIFKNDDAMEIVDVSKDKRYLTLSKIHTRDRSDLYLHDTEKNILKKIIHEEGDVNHYPTGFSVDSKSIYFLTDLDSEFNYLKKYDIQSGTIELVQKENWDIMDNYFSENGKYRVTMINQDSQTVLKIFDVEKNDYLDLPDLPNGNITSINISKSESWMSFYHGGSRSPNDLYVQKIGDGESRKLTNSMNPSINVNYLANAKVIRFRSLDGLEIPAVYYKPPQASTNNKVPALVRVHGGPGGQARVGYNAPIQFLVNNGYAILDINNRGSSGYGKTFQTLDDQAHGKGDLDDCIAARDWLSKLGYVEGDKIGILGGSYGGYMVMAAMTFRPQEFKVGVNIFGVTNWVRTLKSIPPWWESTRLSLYKELGDPNTQEDYLYSISPLFHAKNIKDPVLVLQGSNDPRVLQIESDEMVAAIKGQNVPVEYVVFPDEGHGFTKKKNQISANETILKFLERYLKSERSS